MPPDIIRLTLKSICFCVVNDLKPIVDNLKVHILRHRKMSTKSDDIDESDLDIKSKYGLIDQQNIEVVHSYVIFLCNPLFELPENSVLFSIILCEIAALNSHLQNSLVYALRRMPLNLFRDILRQIQVFLITRMFPNSKLKLQPLVNDWLISSIKVMAILHHTNEMQINYYQNHYNQYTKDALLDFNQKKKYFEKFDHQIEDLRTAQSSILSTDTNFSSLYVSYQDFYIKKLDSLNLFKEYTKWHSAEKIHKGFSFCQYPFMLSIDAKRKILERDSETQMISTAKKSFLQNARVRNHMLPNSGDLFLTIRVRRDYLILDSLNEIEMKKNDLKKKLRVNFIGEAAIDMGGVRKEWLLLLVRQIFSPVYGMFTYVKESENFWFAKDADKAMLAEYNLIGVLMGLAVYNGEILEIRFPPCVYKKLLSDNITVNSSGVLPNLSLYDLSQIMPSIAKSLQNLLDYEGDVQEDFMMKFVASYNEFDTVKTAELKENGANIDLTNENRKEFVELYIDFLLNKSIYQQFKAFYNGFHSVCASNAILLFRPEEIELLVCGSPEPLNINELRMIALYENYTEKDDIIQWFWDIIKTEFNTNQKKRFLLFTTGSDRIPVGGFKEMNFKISRIECKDQLPMAHTCFNQLILPHYKTKKDLKNKLLIAIENAEGFGFR
ncbi:unnamed protein product [Brachionus calyciflorus]|uniref:HECT-type E3 ubiquitin transferase n=1 Tax=Brachionus calyciflorus TaxID=104777 RepID=A0A813M5A5_9BILA|nr:unnamed protein product [Brachionus calyciflorus]